MRKTIPLVAAAVAAAAVGAGFAVQAGGPATAAASAKTAAVHVRAPVPFTVTSTTPAASAHEVSAAAPVSVHFSRPLAADSPMPSLSPAVPGSWSRPDPQTLVFTPSSDFTPFSTVSLSVPGGPNGIRAAGGQALSQPTSERWTIQSGSTLRLQQLLGELGYLPLSWVPSPAGQASSVPGLIPIDPQPGAFAWRFPGTPASLQALWSEGQGNEITTGAVMSFEDVKGLATDGQAGPKVWGALLSAVAAQQSDPRPYSYAMVSTAAPETLTVWQDGVTVVTVKANTGIASAPTAPGTWPVYARYRTTTMSGTNPDGSHYDDPGVPWVSYFHGGDAVHGFDRPGYGYPQSLGCVELDMASAAQVWPLTPLGTLVTVS